MSFVLHIQGELLSREQGPGGCRHPFTGSVSCLGVINDTTVSIFSRSKYRLGDVIVLK